MNYPIPIAVPHSKVSPTSPSDPHAGIPTFPVPQHYYPLVAAWYRPMFWSSPFILTSTLASSIALIGSNACVLVLSFYIQHYFSIHQRFNYFDLSSTDFIMKYPIPTAVPRSKISRTSQKGTHGDVATFPVPQQYHPLVAAWYRPMFWSSPFILTSTLASSIALIGSNVKRRRQWPAFWSFPSIFSIHQRFNYFDLSSTDFIMKYPIPIAVPQSKISRTSRRAHMEASQHSWCHNTIILSLLHGIDLCSGPLLSYRPPPWHPASL
ncbi:unnamed protein product [Nezara viridula]|uniref:Uncharacterized protein n=1 Tax=Nezara viridula TaxID=85310 RepID=A0A9P0EEN8_NEZVI|nr:unnamed protein product [Nezara viridula]